MQRGLFYSRASHIYGLEHGVRINAPSPAHVHAYVQELGNRLSGGELIRDGPSRFPANGAQVLLVIKPVDFYHYAVAGVVQIFCLLEPGPGSNR